MKRAFVRLFNIVNMKIPAAYILFFVVLFNTPADLLFAKDTIRLNSYEEQLRQKFRTLVTVMTNEKREEVNREITSLMVEALEVPGSFSYPFDSLLYMGKIMSPDSLLRLYSWNIPLAGDGNLYSGILQFRDTLNKSERIYILQHSPAPDEEFEFREFGVNDWYGALYYQIVPVELEGKKAYTLIGLDHNDHYTNRKIIDLLIPDNGGLTFGAPVFRMSDSLKNRVVFNYSSRVVMHLRYHEDLEKIVCDHLSPHDPRYKGQYRYYGPDFSYDGFVFEDGEWVYLHDIDVMIREIPETLPEIE